MYYKVSHDTYFIISIVNYYILSTMLTIVLLCSEKILIVYQLRNNYSNFSGIKILLSSIVIYLFYYCIIQISINEWN